MKKFILKPIVLITFVILCALTVSCKKDLLNIKPSKPPARAFFTSENAFQKAVIGVYAKLTGLYDYNNINWLNEVVLLPGDALTTTSTRGLETFNIQPTSRKTTDYFRILYQLINRANVVLQEIKNVKPGVYTTPHLKDYNKGEVLFLRAMAYFRLWNLYGTAPLVTKRVVKLNKLHPPNSKGTELLDRAIKDLQTAADLLPVSWSKQNRGRATKNSAYGMLGKYLVFRATVTHSDADYKAAIQAFNKIKGVHLVANFEDNFDYRTENNAESLFEFQAGSGPSSDNIYLSNDADFNVGQASAYWGFFDNNYAQYGQALFIATHKLVNAFEPGDPRLPLTVNTTNYHITKYVLHNKLNNFAAGSRNNPRILRYAAVLLYKAEAVLHSGGSTKKAIKLINKVRTRARNMGTTGVPKNFPLTETNRKTIFHWIMNERLRELAGEGHRWFNLRRWALGGYITLNNAFFDSDIPKRMQFKKYKLYFPIPQVEIDKDPNVKQNPGY